jgi:hypothetical protein
MNLPFNAAILGGVVVKRSPFFGQDRCSMKSLNTLADAVEPMSTGLNSTSRLFWARANWDKSG